ncbi:unnamed protein product [Cyprideis torosa]|uniref:Uncharacterized protein n=1 Tax=Cyprideis torosa TaxID=163714 RepID=A0A7R8WD66_9CRUS|nr:unnamed protein product [Cyprideis torosa]CAG0888049.1 unnamed protein product [Cyprideis torosa]
MPSTSGNVHKIYHEEQPKDVASHRTQTCSLRRRSSEPAPLSAAIPPDSVINGSSRDSLRRAQQWLEESVEHMGTISPPASANASPVPPHSAHHLLAPVGLSGPQSYGPGPPPASSSVTKSTTSYARYDNSPSENPHPLPPVNIPPLAPSSTLPPATTLPDEDSATTSSTRHLLKHYHGAILPPSPDPSRRSSSTYYSPTESPLQSRHLSSSGFSSPALTSRSSPGISRNNSDASQGGGNSNPSPMSPRRNGVPPTASTSDVPFPAFLPSNFTVASASSCSRLLFHPSASLHASASFERDLAEKIRDDLRDADVSPSLPSPPSLSCPPGSDLLPSLSGTTGISRQQLINSPCPVCGDKISGFHYGIFSCESCKGFFKRTVQNKKNYICLRGANCPISIATRKKCPACRFEKCLKMGMKLEAIREDRTRGGRSTYQCSYTIPSNLVPSGEGGYAAGPSSGPATPTNPATPSSVSSEPPSPSISATPPSTSRVKQEEGACALEDVEHLARSRPNPGVPVPLLLEQIMSVEHLWHHSPELQPASSRPPPPNPDDEGFLSSLCHIADHRLYKIVKWCKSLPLFHYIQIDDQIALLINAWCELLLFSCCFRSVPSPGLVRISEGRSVTLPDATEMGWGPCVERMLGFIDHLRRLKVDQYEFVALKVIILLTSDVSGLKEAERVRASQEQVLEALQQYTLSQYPHMPSKYGELLVRIPELERTCQFVVQTGKEMLSQTKKEGEKPGGFNLLMELLRGEH